MCPFSRRLANRLLNACGHISHSFFKLSLKFFAQLANPRRMNGDIIHSDGRVEQSSDAAFVHGFGFVQACVSLAGRGDPLERRHPHIRVLALLSKRLRTWGAIRRRLGRVFRSTADWMALWHGDSEKALAAICRQRRFFRRGYLVETFNRNDASNFFKSRLAGNKSVILTPRTLARKAVCRHGRGGTARPAWLVIPG